MHDPFQKCVYAVEGKHESLGAQLTVPAPLESHSEFSINIIA